MKTKAATLVAASTLALLSACSSPQVQPSAPVSRTATDEAFDPITAPSAASEAADLAAAQADAEEAAYNATHPPRPHKPGPSAGFPPAPTVPPIPGRQFRADILRLMESIQTLDGANREHVEAVMGVKMGKPERTERWFAYYGSADEGWGYNMLAYPRDDQPNSTISFDLFPKRLPGGVIAQCTFDADDFIADLKKAGWTIDDGLRFERSGRRFWSFGRTLPDINLTVGGLIYIYFRDTNAATGPSCVSGMRINAALSEDDA